MLKKRIDSYRKNQYIRLTMAFSFLAVLMLIIFTDLFQVSRNNVLSIGHLNSVQMAQNLEYYLIEEIDEIALAARTVEIMQDTGKSNEDILDYLVFESRVANETIDENYTGLYGYINGEYLDGSGWVPAEGYNSLERPWYQGALAGKGKVVYITPYIDMETGTMMMSLCKLLADSRSVVSLDVSLERIQEIVESDSFAEYDQVIVTDKNFVVVAATDTEILGKSISDDPLIKQFKNEGPIKNSYGHYDYRNDEGQLFSVFSSKVGEEWHVFLTIRNSELMRSLKHIYAILISCTVAFIFFVSLLFDYLNKRRKAAENLNIQLESIADIYISVHKFDLEHDTYEEVRCLPYVREQIRVAEQTSVGFSEVLEKVMKALVRDEYWEAMKAFIDMSTLNLRVGNSNTVTQEFLGVHGWTKARIVILERKNDRISSILWMIENIDEEKRKQNELRHLSETDSMTEIRNRGCGERLVKEALQNGAGGMFCLMDADQFKSINDTYGHDTGDEVLQTIAGCMKATFRKSDIFFRMGGDEFAAFVPGMDNENRAEGLFARFISELERVNIPAFKGERKIEISIGASFIGPGNVKDFETLYKEADRAVYRSKKVSGCYVTYYREDMTSDI